ncbi:hypothetical protein BJY01DRAFT_215226 [Aspergillus pseudoustus]|uniref:Glycosyltransferase family 28 N-terminal domain-containing protein n=1 Tax=Aspergillus pseudoustus TaxID=1810923 RepID=A0ABR4JVV1_9EURO
MSHHAADGISSEDWADVTDASGRPAQRLREGLDTGVRVMEDGRLDIKLSEHKPWLQRIARHTKEHPYPRGPIDHRPSVTFDPDEEESYPLRLNIVIQVIGSRGDIQPFIAIGQRLHAHGHRVRLATHLSFRETVQDANLEFFNIGGDPAELMAFMVKNPGLLPDMRTIRSGAIRKRRREMRDIFSGCWRSCFEMGDGTGIEHHVASDPWSEEVDYRHLPFVADVVIANPPSFAHISCAEKLGVPLNLMFTMPWSATQAFPHPLANIHSKNTKPSVANFASYAIVEIMLWEGLGDLINRFRKRELGLDPLDALRAPGIAHRLRIPYTYLWSPALLSKPLDWPGSIDVVGFSTLPETTSYKPPDDLAAFLASGPPPIYIGFGSIVVDNPSRLTNIVFTAIRATGHRALVSRGWGNIGADQPAADDILMLDKVPHDWLFHRVSAVVHHGGAGTTAAGLIRGRPTVIVPFFGDQMFWGSIVARAGAGPEPVPYKQLTSEKLADAIRFALRESTLEKAEELGVQMREEEGARNTVCSFYRHLDVAALRCELCPGRPAVWWVKGQHSRNPKGKGVKLSAFAATVLVETGLLKPHDLVLYRSKEYDTSRDPRGPISAGAEVLYGVVTDFVSAIAEVPTDVAEMIRAHGQYGDHRRSGESRRRHRHRHFRHGQRRPNPACEWKKDHFARGQMDSVVGSSTPSRTSKEKDEGKRGSAARGEPGSGSGSDEASESESESLSRRSSSASNSNLSSISNSDSSPAADSATSYASAHSQSHSHSNSPSNSSKQSPPLADIAAAISRTPTSHDPDLTAELKTLSLENTLRRQQSRENAIEVREVLADARYHASRAGKHLLDWILLLPTDLSLSFSKGFHNAPKLYHDPMVQETPTVRGVRGGLRAAGTEFTQEFYQGITGLVTQPRYGHKEGGTKGMLKGVGKGVGGAFFKPAAGLWGLIGYPLDGVHKSLRHSLGKSKVKEILASRISQGLGEMVAASPEERATVIRRWNEIQKRHESHGS